MKPHSRLRRALRRPPLHFALVGALLFGLFHLSIARLIPATAFGLVLGAMVLACDNAVPGMIAHGLNNGIALLVATGATPDLARLIEERSNWLLAAAIGLCILGSGLLRDRRTGTKNPW